LDGYNPLQHALFNGNASHSIFARAATLAVEIVAEKIFPLGQDPLRSAIDAGMILLKLEGGMLCRIGGHSYEDEIDDQYAALAQESFRELREHLIILYSTIGICQQDNTLDSRTNKWCHTHGVELMTN